MLLAENKCLRKVKPSHTARGWGQMKTWGESKSTARTQKATQGSHACITAVHSIENIFRVEDLEEMPVVLLMRARVSARPGASQSTGDGLGIEVGWDNGKWGKRARRDAYIS